MQIIRSKVLGYCNGVSRVIELALECVDRAHKEGRNAYTIGWFIHNPHVVARFEAQGMKHIDSPQGHEPGIALIRAHGIPDTLRNEFLEAHFTLLDGTCGTVAYSQQLVRDVRDDQQVIIIGLKNHSEVVALSGVLRKEGQEVPVIVIESEEDFIQIDPHSTKELLCVVQTTFESDIYEHLINRLKETFGQKVVFANRLCPSTKRRHDALLQIMKVVDAVLVVGGKMSANTAALAQVVKDGNIPVWHIEGVEHIPDEIFSFEKVGVTAGTSTPEEDIRAIIEVLEGSTH